MLSNKPVVAIVGVGLIGGSLGLALRARGLAERVIGVGRKPDRLQLALELGQLDEYSTELEPVVARSQIVVFCTPVDRIPVHAAAAADVAMPGTLLTDVGSTKGSICEDMEWLAEGDVCFIGSHPMAGSDRSGCENASASLFESHTCIVTPVDETPADRLADLENFWRGVGMKVVRMGPREHDEAVALVSHLPHVAASALASMLTPEVRNVAASGFRDTTRIARGDAELWTEILFDNADNVADRVAAYVRRLQDLERALRLGDRDSLTRLLEVARRRRTELDQP